jgi:hypothetical protein
MWGAQELLAEQGLLSFSLFHLDKYVKTICKVEKSIKKNFKNGF